MAKVLGLDLGTSTSAVAVLERGAPRILEDDPRFRIMASCVSFMPDGQVTVGDKARNQAPTNPDFTFVSLKRLLGRRFDDPHVAELAERVGYEIVAGDDGAACVRGPDRIYSPEELLGHIVRELKKRAALTLGQQVTHAVVGVPANFDVLQKEAVRRAVRAGGLEPLGLLSEPTAAAIAYGRELGAGKTIAVYDLGGGTFDVSILKISGQRFRVLATAGDAWLGGEDFDQRLVDALAERFRAKHGLDLRGDAMSLQRLRLAAEEIKLELSGADEHRLTDAWVAKDPDTGAKIDMDETFTREQYEELVGDLIERTRQPCLDAMKAARIDQRQIDQVVMVGGMTRTPAVIALAAEVFGRTPKRTINPIEAVALGCAVQAAARAGELKSIHLDEVTNASFGVEAGGGAFAPIIKRGSAIPTAKTVRTGNFDADATQVVARIYQGDLKHAADNRLVCRLALEIEPQPKGQADLDLKLDLDEDGVLTVKLIDARTKRYVERRVHADTGLDGDALADIRGLSEDDEIGPETDAGEDSPAAEPEPIEEPIAAAAAQASPPPGEEPANDDDAAWDDFDASELERVGR